MVEKHNTKQLLMVALYAFMGLCGYAAGYALLRFAFWSLHSFSRVEIGFGPMHGIIVVLLLAATWSGYRMWLQRGGLASYYESGMYVDLDADTGGARVVEHYATRVTAPAYLISQLLMAGPLWLLRAGAHWKNRVTPRPGLSEELAGILVRLRAANKWQGLRDYPQSDHEAILLLGKIGHVDLSFAKGSPRFKAHVE